MHVLWLIPDYFTFLVDEMLALAPSVRRLSVFSQAAPSTEVAGVHPVSVPRDRPAVHRALVRGSYVLQSVMRGAWPRGVGDLPKVRRLARHNEVIRDFVRREAVDVIHSHFAVPEGTGGWQAACDRPIVITLRGVDILSVPAVNYGFIRDRFYVSNLKRAMHYASAVTVASELSRAATLRICPEPGKVRLIPNGIDVVRFANRDAAAARRVRQQHDLGDRPVILAVGNLVSNKAYDKLVQAFAKVRQQYSDAVLLIVGEGPERESLVALARRLGISDAVRLPGRVPCEQMTDYYAAADLFAHPSLSEGFGNVVLEAMARGCAVVATCTGAAADLIRDGRNGLLVEPGDVSALTSAITRMLDDPGLRRSCGCAAAQTVREGYCLDDRAKAFVAIYEECFRRKSGRRRRALSKPGVQST